ncbi:MAG: twin-arginine translocation signal domain-containing protein [Chloroflexi bacterium]|nr:twin-arginine translocation signal domain-containing protein [Chloroflexota bacterium]
MKKTLSRRDFLKMAGGSSLALATMPSLSPMFKSLYRRQGASLTALWVAFDPLLNASQKLFDLYSAETGTAIEVQTVPFSDWDRTIRSTPFLTTRLI